MKVYRVTRAVDYKGQCEREMFYTQDKEEAEGKYIDFQMKVRRFAEEHGLKLYDGKYELEWYSFADGNQRGKPYTGSRAELKVNEYCKEDFFVLCNGPIF
jgi:predicted adenine nucleotide alpha hydrolase (AANH) superfamily ATPase